jgi:hypothetical protein
MTMRSTALTAILKRAWPGALLSVGLAVTAAWIGLLGFGLFQLGALAF